MKRTASAKKKSRSNGSSRKRPVRAARYAVCVRNGSYAASLELRKLYKVLPDPPAAEHNLLRVVDESGEDYLYPKSCFMPLRLPQPVRKAVLEVA